MSGPIGMPKRLVARLGASLVAGVLLIVGLFAGLVYAATPSFFAAVPGGGGPDGPIGVAATPSQLYVSEYCSGKIDQIDSAGNVTLFATVPVPNPPPLCTEKYLAVSPGLGGFAPNDLYVIRGPDVWRIPPTGSPVTLFATVGLALTGSHSGITFDKVGTFGNDMIVTRFNGDVWRVNSSGTPTFVVNVGDPIEGPDVAPLGFGPLGGQVLAAAEITGNVYAVSSVGVVTVMANWTGAESAHVIPPNPCSYGISGGAFFTAIYGVFNAAPTHIEKFPPSDFAGLGGKVLVTGETGPRGIGLITFDSLNNVYVVTPFQGDIGQHEGSAFVDCAVPSLRKTQGFWKNHPLAWPVTSLNLGTQTYSQAQLLAILNTPIGSGNGGDASLILADQLIAAKLNIANGADPAPVATTIADADTLLSALVGTLPYGVKPSSSTGQPMVADATALDAYNNG